jgi:hypothetical protein
LQNFADDTGGHMHDGGENVKINLNNQTICDSHAIYNAKSVTTGSSRHGAMGDSMSGMTTCEDVVKLKKDDELSVSAYFNATAHPM